VSLEFNLIGKYFNRPHVHTDLGVGDDAALLTIKEGCQLAVSSDTLVAGTHFFEDCQPYRIGWKSMAVNISDMAAMGANPKWATLAIALPHIDESWLSEFSRGLFACAQAYKVDLIGGDTTRGPLNISVTIMGEVAASKALLRSGAALGDDIWVSGELGNAALGLQFLLKKFNLTEDEQKVCLDDLYMPQPRVPLGLALHGLASSCIDISDGLIADLSHILKASKLGANVYLNKINCLPTMKHRLDEDIVRQAILTGGDDYELCFTAPEDNKAAIVALGEQLGVPLSCVGNVTQGEALNVLYEGRPVNLNKQGYDHFA